jgi:hypothetical protein
LLPNSARHFSFLLNDFSNQQHCNETTARPKSIASREDSTGNHNEERSDLSDVDKQSKLLVVRHYQPSAPQREMDHCLPRAMGGVAKQPIPAELC